MAEPEAYQEVHSPTVSVEVKISGTRNKEQCRRRLLDARLWDVLSDDQQRAAVYIEIGHRAFTRGMGISPPKYERTDPGKHQDGLTGYVERYFDWCEETRRFGVNAMVTIDVLCFGLTLRNVDRTHKRRKGWSRDQLHRALDLYAMQQGWVARRGSFLL